MHNLVRKIQGKMGLQRPRHGNEGDIKRNLTKLGYWRIGFCGPFYEHINEP
jgi:hypothetical protein